MPTTPLSIYLLKNDVKPNTKYLKLLNVESNNVEIEGTTSKLHLQTPTSNPPAFAQLFTANKELKGLDFGTNQSTGAVLEVSHAGNTFLIAFGSGRFLIEDSYMVPDFGLKAALNLVKAKDIRGIDTASNKSTPLNNHIQSGLGAKVSDFPIDIDEDYLSAIEGLSNETLFGSRVSGRRKALKINFKSSLNSLPKLLLTAYTKYKEALPKEFKWFENSREVIEPSIIKQLNGKLLKSLKKFSASGPEQGISLEMITPDIYNPDDVSFLRYGRSDSNKTELLELGPYLKFIKPNKGAFKLADLEAVKNRVFTLDESNKSINSWRGYDCIYCEFEHDKKYFELRAGTWYEINGDFVKEINAVMERIPTYKVSLPKYNHDSEGAYNKAVAKGDSNIKCMDTKNIYIGGGQSRFEFCDLVHRKNGHDNLTDLIHVKHYTSSATLSHLFAQGAVSAEIFRSSEEAREKMYTGHPNVMPLTNPAIKPNAGDYRVVYAIYDITALPTKLPFFSKVNLKNAYNRLQLLGYEVALAHIDVDPVKKAQLKVKASQKRVKLGKAA